METLYQFLKALLHVLQGRGRLKIECFEGCQLHLGQLAARLAVRRTLLDARTRCRRAVFEQNEGIDERAFEEKLQLRIRRLGLSLHAELPGRTKTGQRRALI